LAAAAIVASLVVAPGTSLAAPTVPVPPTAAPSAAAAAASLPTPPTDVAACPWLAEAIASGASPAALAQMTVARMTLQEKLAELVLVSSGPYENVNQGVARLCIPSLTLSDGPWGLAYGDTGVSLLPSPLGLASSFDPALARRYGEVIGAEARGQGIEVSQGPNLNLDRVPEWGRAAESYGEDPLLTAAMGTADIQGLQSQGVLADVKHLVAYNQETNRGSLDAKVAERPLQELYLAPLRAALLAGKAASVMCAYPHLNGTYQCEDPALTALLARSSTPIFVRSDLGAVHDQPAAVSAGVDLIKPTTVSSLAGQVASGVVPASAVDANLTQVLTTLFATGVVGRPATGAPGTVVETPAHRAFALTAAERSAVLLRNQGGLLPLTPGRTRSIAVIGAAASTFPVTQGHGSSHVVPPFTSTPLAALRARYGRSTSVTYAPGGSTTKNLPAIPSRFLTPSSGTGHGLTLTVGPATGADPSITVQSPVPAATLDRATHPEGEPATTAPPTTEAPGAEHANPPGERPEVERNQSPRDRLVQIDPTAASAPTVTLPYGWTGSHARWTGFFTPPRSGRFAFSIAGTGSMQMTLDGKTVVSDLLPHGTGSWAGTAILDGHHRYRLALDWTPIPDATNLGIPSLVDLGMAYVGDAVRQAVAAARAAQVAVVFAADYSAETFDRPSLSLPGDQDALIAAVAAANPRTVVVLDTSGPVLMPWRDKVAAVLEAWYPGEQDGAAAAALLSGQAAPTGHLPVTFPASQHRSAVSTAAQWPGVDLVATYSEGLRVGYRWNHATGTAPLYPFGFGLTYTTFRFGTASLVTKGDTRRVVVPVTNTGARSGSDVIQAYLSFPSSAGEPPGQLVAFSPVTVPAGGTRRVTLAVPPSALQVYSGGRWSTPAGTYRIGVGDSSASTPAQVSFTAG
jgi:beta-glucosidase